MTLILKHNPKSSSTLLPFIYTDRIDAGFPSPASDYLESSLDLNEYLIKNPIATFYLRATSNTLRTSGIFAGDLLIVDRSILPKSGDIVIVALDGELVIKRYTRKGQKINLLTDDEKSEPIHLSTLLDFTIWGVATTVIHSL